jgi:hypothetical protein
VKARFDRSKDNEKETEEFVMMESKKQQTSRSITDEKLFLDTNYSSFGKHLLS